MGVNFHILEGHNPQILDSSSAKASDILSECNKETFELQEQVKSILVDMKCPLKLTEVKIQNSPDGYKIGNFSVSASSSKDGPWDLIFTDKLKENTEQVYPN